MNELDHFEAQVLYFFNDGKSPNWIENWIALERQNLMQNIDNHDDLKRLNQATNAGRELLKACVKKVTS